ncbi:MAG: carboxypeptidase regulatory-like domain-containing protein [Acidobacteriota bacterium]
MALNHFRPLTAVAIFTLLTACGGSPAPASSAPPADAKRVDVSKAGTVSGRVMLDGAAPANPPVKLAADPYCVQQHPKGATFENFVVDDGGLENVFVYVKDGLDGYYFEPPTESVTLDQQGCQYRPHVLGVQTGQKLQISNSDDTLHNVHGMGQANQEFNAQQQMKHITTDKVFAKREVMMPFKCDVHSWMHAFVGVVEHPYFAVTHDGGKFELKNLPAGTYTVEAWHEKLGTQTQSVTLAEKASKPLTFTFKAPAAPAAN